jgi:hypothetical protein
MTKRILQSRRNTFRLLLKRYPHARVIRWKSNGGWWFEVEW